MYTAISSKASHSAPNVACTCGNSVGAFGCALLPVLHPHV